MLFQSPKLWPNFLDVAFPRYRALGSGDRFPLFSPPVWGNLADAYDDGDDIRKCIIIIGRVVHATAD